MSTAALGDSIHINVLGTLDDGGEFENTTGNPPLKLELGNGSVMPALEKELVGMAAGDEKTVQVAAADAFGPYSDDNIHVVKKNEIPDNVELIAGNIISATTEDGNNVNFLVVELNDTTVTLDGNHPLAGKDLTFQLELLEILSP